MDSLNQNIFILSIFNLFMSYITMILFLIVFIAFIGTLRFRGLMYKYYFTHEKELNDIGLKWVNFDPTYIV